MSTSIDQRQATEQHSMLINGQWLAANDFLPVENPARRGSVIAHVSRGRAKEVDKAVRAADAAFEVWRAAPWRERGRALLRVADAVEAETETLARLLASETGNAIRGQARPEIRSAVDVFRYFAGVASELKGETIPLTEQMLSYTRRDPIGVVGAIVPWNAPVVLSAVKIAPAVAAGNTIVLKPSMDAPLTVLALARICNQHLPPGVLNVVTGTGPECGAALAEHFLVRKLSFTGNTETGRSVMRAAAERIVPVSLELGGKSPAIVFADSDDERTVDGVIAGMRFSRQGQSCTAGSRLFLHASIFDSFLGKLSRKLAALRIGDPLDEATDVGAIINRQQFDKVCGYIAEGLEEPGMNLVVGGLPPGTGPLSEGYFAIPTVIANARNDWRVSREEIFGPVLMVIPWTDQAEAIRMANETHYGLAAYVWTRDITQALVTAHRIDAGWIQVNQGSGQFPGQSYGGYKQSGIGREYSLEGMLDSYTQRKNVTISLQ